jgi:hypothetical protein
MKITKRQLRRLIREEKRKLLKEVAHGLTPGIGFANWESNNNRSSQGFAQAYHSAYADNTSTAAKVAVRRSNGAPRASLQEAINEAYYTLEEALRRGDSLSIERACTNVRNLLGSKLK